MLVLIIQSCLSLCSPIDCSPPGSSVCGILQARILERVATSFSRQSARSRVKTCVSHVFCIAGGFFTTKPREKLWRTPKVISNDSGNIDWKYLTWELIDRWQASEIPVQLIMESSSWTYKACILCTVCSHIQQGNICLPWNDMQRSDQTGVL